MSTHTVSAQSHPNIAFIKYWGNQDDVLRIPANGSISMNLGGLCSTTRVAFVPSLERDVLWLNGAEAGDAAVQRASLLLDIVRDLAGLADYARIQSYNNFPTGTGIASSASGFAALALAASRAAGLDLGERDLSRLARRLSGSACRSIPPGFVEWQVGTDDQSSYAISIAPPDHWALVDCIAIVSQTHKSITSQEGHSLAVTSPLQAARVGSTVQRLETCREAILKRDFEALADVVELDSNLMHAVMMTSSPRLYYWQPETVRTLNAVRQWRQEGLPACFTVDAGPNVHVICEAPYSQAVFARLVQLEGVMRVLTAVPGGPARASPEAGNDLDHNQAC